VTAIQIQQDAVSPWWIRLYAIQLWQSAEGKKDHPRKLQISRARRPGGEGFVVGHLLPRKRRVLVEK
jgi:hypothetical protein